MGKTKEKYVQDLRVVSVMPYDTFEELRHFDGVYKIAVYDNNMRVHYRQNEEWQEAFERYEQARDIKKLIEDRIDYTQLDK